MVGIQLAAFVAAIIVETESVKAVAVEGLGVLSEKVLALAFVGFVHRHEMEWTR